MISTLRTAVTAGTAALLAAALLTGPARADATASLVDPATPAGAQPTAGPAGTLVFSDEFTGSTLNTAKWKARDQERTEADRTDGLRTWYKPQNVRVVPENGGNLAIDLRKLGDKQYAGGRVDTDGIFDYTHGTFEARLHVPPANGHLGAVWLQTHSWGNIKGSAEDGAEIDLIESAYNTDKYAATIHYDGYGADHVQSAQVVPAPGLHADHYHTIGLNWTATKMEFTYDGTVVRTVTDPQLISQVKEYPILSHEILEWAAGDVTTAPLDHTSTMYVDHVRIWK
ncbi:family 16 glycosylhydrolase [Streptomyces sp. NPDC087440]|uniref:glycoside hydrolase family 16 protein n=1 Tax=Streptomyces sp. NPDC087440 TaxID=3365790 RepID=UPI0037FDED0F